MTEPELIRVLLVEDHPADARLVREMVAMAGGDQFAIHHVLALEAALECLAGQEFDVVLVDLSLPDSHGLETMLRIQREACELPVVVLSGLNDEAIAIQAVQAGAQDYLVKGWGNGNMLVRALRYAMARKQAEGSLMHMAQHDPLTGLPNRHLFQQRLDRAIEHARRHRRSMALLLLDLDYFKEINDTLGHPAGDETLQAVAHRIRQCVRSRDTVARLGGDEFAIVLEEIAGQEDVTLIADKVLEAIARPCCLNGRNIFLHASIGVALFPEAGGDAQALVRNADAALYRAKSAGRNGYRMFESATLVGY